MSDSKIKSVKVAKNVNTIVSNPNNLTGNPFPGDKFPGPKTYICFHEVEDDDEYDSGDKAVIHIKLAKPEHLLSKTSRI